MEPASTKQPKAEEFIEVIPDEERELVLQKDAPSALWPAAGHAPAAGQHASGAGSQRAEAYLSATPRDGRGSADGPHGRDAPSRGHITGRLGRPRDSARRSPFLAAAQQQLDKVGSSRQGEIPGQLISPTKVGPHAGGGWLGERAGHGIESARRRPNDVGGQSMHEVGGGIVEVGTVDQGDVLIQVI